MTGKAKKGNIAWPKCTVNIYLTYFTDELTFNTLVIELLPLIALVNLILPLESYP